MKKHLLYSTYVKDTYPDVQIQVFRKAIKVNGIFFNEDIINLFEFSYKFCTTCGRGFLAIINHSCSQEE